VIDPRRRSFIIKVSSGRYMRQKFTAPRLHESMIFRGGADAH